MSNMSELDHDRQIAIGEMAVSLVRYINYEMSMSWEHMHYDDRLDAIIKWFTDDGDDDQVMCPHDWVGEALHRRVECAMMIAKLPGPDAKSRATRALVDGMLPVNPPKSPYMHDGMVKVTDIGKHEAFVSSAAQRWSDGLDKIITPVIAPEEAPWRGDEAELRILELENELDKVKAQRSVGVGTIRALKDELATTKQMGKRLQDERNRFARGEKNMCHNFTEQGKEVIQLRDEVDQLTGNLSIKTSMLDLVEARLNKYVAAEAKEKRERGNL